MKKYIPILLGIFLLVMTLGVVSASVVTAPASGTNQTANFDVYATYTNATDGTGARNPSTANTTFYYKTTGAWTSGTYSSFASNASTVWFTVAITSLSDALGYSFNVSAGNNTATEVGTGIVSAIGIDDTSPVISTAIDRKSITTGGLFKYTTSVSDATTGLSSSSCTMTDPEGTNTSLASASNTDELFQTSRLIDKGTWTLSCTGTDVAGNSNSGSSTLTADPSGRIQVTNQTTGKNNTWIILIIIGGAIALIWLSKRQ